MKFKGSTCWIGAVFVGSILSGCLQTSGPDDEVAVISDGTYTPSMPVPPEGWPAIQWPEDNPYTSAKAILGRRLFFETALSRDRTVSCAWCHASGHAFADRHRSALSVGVRSQHTFRNTPTLANLAFASSFMFEGDVPTLELQALRPLMSSIEMDMTEQEILARLSSDTLYVRLFRQAFGKGPISLTRLARALATFERTLVSLRSPYDRWVAGDTGALSVEAKRGAAIFFGDKARCSRCHTPPLFTDGSFRHNGYFHGDDSVSADSGRARSTKLATDVGKFKTPTLRNVFHTYPFMHDGGLPSLEEVVLHYNSGGFAHQNRDTLIRPLGLNDYEIYELVQFLESLTDISSMLQIDP
jgi:cytochrome c peroxidase